MLTLGRLNKKDALPKGSLARKNVPIVIFKASYVKRPVLATKMAAEQGAAPIVLTTALLKLFSSNAAIFVLSVLFTLIETLTGNLLARAGINAINDIQKFAEQIHQPNEIPQAI